MAPSAAPRTHQGMQFVDEEDDVATLRDLVHDRLQALFELAAVLGSGDYRRHVQRQQAVVLERLGDLARRNDLREPLDDGGLPHPRFSDQDRVVLLAATENLDDAFDLHAATYGRIELAPAREIRKVAAEMVEGRGLGFLVGLAAGRYRRTPADIGTHLGAQHPETLRTSAVQAHVHRVQHLRGDALLFPEKPQQQVFRANVGMVEFARLRQGELQDLLCTRGIGQLPQGDGGLAFADRLLHPLVNLAQIHPEIHQHRGGDAFPLPDQAEQHMLGPHIVVLQSDGFVPGHREHLAHPIREIVVHLSSWPRVVMGRGRSWSRSRGVPCPESPHPR